MNVKTSVNCKVENVKPRVGLSPLLHCFSVELAAETRGYLMYRGLGGSKGGTGKQGNIGHTVVPNVALSSVVLR
jgi:hypothetical protein